MWCNNKELFWLILQGWELYLKSPKLKFIVKKSLVYLQSTVVIISTSYHTYFLKNSLTYLNISHHIKIQKCNYYWLPCPNLASLQGSEELCLEPPPPPLTPLPTWHWKWWGVGHCTHHALAAATLGAEGGHCPDTGTSPSPLCSQCINSQTLMDNNRKCHWNSGKQQFCIRSFEKCCLL